MIPPSLVSTLAIVSAGAVVAAEGSTLASSFDCDKENVVKVSSADSPSQIQFVSNVNNNLGLRKCSAESATIKYARILDMSACTCTPILDRGL